jgi:hypothetical protein
MASRVCLALAAVGWAPCAGSECQRGGHAATGSAASVFHHAPCQRSAGPLCRAGRPEWRTDRLSARLYRLVVLLQSGPAPAPPALPRLRAGSARPRRLRAAGLLLHRGGLRRRRGGLLGRRRGRAGHPGGPLGELLGRPVCGRDPPRACRPAGADRRPGIAGRQREELELQTAVRGLREEEDQLAVAIPGARVVVYPATGHSPNWERPERVAADLDAFIWARGSRPPPQDPLRGGSAAASSTGNARRCWSVLGDAKQTRGNWVKKCWVCSRSQRRAGAGAVDANAARSPQESAGDSHHGHVLADGPVEERAAILQQLKPRCACAHGDLQARAPGYSGTSSTKPR